MKNFCDDLFFFGEHLRLCPWSLALALASSILVLGLESVCPRKGCPWPWIFFVSLALASSLVSSTPPLIVKLQLAKIMHSVHNNNISNLYFGFFKVEKFYHYCTRTSTNSNFVQTSARTEKGKSTISFSGPKIWREIPSDLKNLSNNSFKYQYKRRLLNCYTE